VQFDSLPLAGVFAEGHSAELCHTPCTYRVDVTDGGPAERRTFVLHAEGYRDRPIVVDLSSSQHAYNVTLDQLAPAVGAGTGPATTGTAHKPRGHHGKPKPTDTKPVESKPDDGAGSADSKPAEPKPVDSKPPDKIDPADTLDPFHRSPS
jgi:hypothetical protein